MIDILTIIACMWLIIASIFYLIILKKPVKSTMSFKIFTILIGVYAATYIADKFTLEIITKEISFLIVMIVLAVNFTWQIILIKKSNE